MSKIGAWATEPVSATPVTKVERWRILSVPDMAELLLVPKADLGRSLAKTAETTALRVAGAACPAASRTVPVETMRQPKPTTDQPARSLLQKAVRRSCPDVVAKTLDYLCRLGDLVWLRQRVGVIVSEECWPLLHNWQLPSGRGRNGAQLQRAAIEDVLCQAAATVKYKDAAGLGSLAYAYSERDSSATMHLPPAAVAAVEHVSWGINNTARFLARCESRCSDDHCVQVITNAKLVHRRRGWPWDMAFPLAAAYLCATTGFPRMQAVAVREIPRGPTAFAQFPFWVALDRHTREGKSALSLVARRHRVSVSKLNWVSFYCETGRSANAASSLWWGREAEWRLRKLGTSLEEAEALWEIVRRDFVDSVRCFAATLRERVLTVDASGRSRELPLLSRPQFG